MTRRMIMATVALLGFFVALYLALYKLGAIGSLSCTVGSCETVQLSRWADFLGVPVAVWGVGFYTLTFALALAGSTERFTDSRAVAVALVAVTGPGLIFSLWLTWLELFVIAAICMWCVVSAVLVAVLFVLGVQDLRERSTASGPSPGENGSPLSRGNGGERE
ncbi:MAG: vitamin K epoxide reductase family protein [Gemmatimonadaceae bacterium]